MYGFDESNAPRSASHPKKSARAQESEVPLKKNWEERLAAARAARKKILEEKGNPSPEKAAKSKPSLGNGAEGLTHAFKRSDQDGTSSFLDRPQGETENTPDRSVETDGAVISASAPAKASVLSLTAIIFIAFACFFGLGAGIMLGFGAIVGMGWVPLGGTEPHQQQSETTALGAKPQVQSYVANRIVSLAGVENGLALISPAVTPFAAEQGVAPVLYPATAADTVIAPVKSPGKNIDTTGGKIELVSELDVQPNGVEAEWAAPAYVALAPDLLQQVDENLSDQIPVLPERNSVSPMMVVASLHAPVWEQGQHLITSLDHPSPQPAQSPLLVKSLPGAVPANLNDRLGQLYAFDGGLTKIAMLPPSDTTLQLDVSPFAPPPEIAAQTIALASYDFSFDLPEVGRPHARELTLAEKLGFNRETVGRINLVTIAPTGVTDDQLADNVKILNATGFSDSKVNPVNYRVSKTHVRYYSPQDKAIASAIAAEVGGKARDFTGNRSLFPPGRVEIYLEGRPTRTRPAENSKRTATDRQVDQKARLENSIVGKLRRGEQFGASR